MKKRISKRLRFSFSFSLTVVGLISTLLTITGYSLESLPFSTNIWVRIGIVLSLAIIICFITYLCIGFVFSKSIKLKIRNTPVEILCGDIFNIEGLRVIGCDTKFDTRVDDIVISKRSLHGQLVTEHGHANEIRSAVKNAAKRLNLPKEPDGFYHFSLGSIVKYDSNVDGKTYLMLAMTRLNDNYEARTNMSEFEPMLLKMWSEIDRVYASKPVVLPLLGAGIVRFDSIEKEKSNLLRCILCTLNASGVNLNCEVKIVIHGNTKDMSLFEFKDLF